MFGKASTYCRFRVFTYLLLLGISACNGLQKLKQQQQQPGCSERLEGCSRSFFFFFFFLGYLRSFFKIAAAKIGPSKMSSGSLRGRHLSLSVGSRSAARISARSGLIDGGKTLPNRLEILFFSVGNSRKKSRRPVVAACVSSSSLECPLDA